MSYLLLIMEPVGQRAQRSRPEGEAAYASMQQFADSLRARGQLKAVESLASSASAVRVQAEGGRMRLLDGPFAEAKEMVGGFFLIDCATMAEAIEIARECPAAQWATVEVRALAPCFAESLAEDRASA